MKVVSQLKYYISSAFIFKTVSSPFLYHYSHLFVKRRHEGANYYTKLLIYTMGKKEKSSNSENKEMASLYADTSCNKDAGISTWEGMYNLLEDENPVVIKVVATTGSKDSSEENLRDLACSFLHRIAARPRILPYTDMVRWVLDSTDISDRQLRTPSEELIGSFTIEDVRLMYKLPEPQATYKKKFMEYFSREHANLAECTKEWTKRSEPLKKNKHGWTIPKKDVSDVVHKFKHPSGQIDVVSTTR